MKRLIAILGASLLPVSACGPVTEWNCDVGRRRCHDGVLQECVLDHADVSGDGTIIDYVGKWIDLSQCT